METKEWTVDCMPDTLKWHEMDCMHPSVFFCDWSWQTRRWPFFCLVHSLKKESREGRQREIATRQGKHQNSTERKTKSRHPHRPSSWRLPQNTCRSTRLVSFRPPPYSPSCHLLLSASCSTSKRDRKIQLAASQGKHTQSVKHTFLGQSVRLIVGARGRERSPPFLLFIPPVSSALSHSGRREPTREKTIEQREQRVC